MPELPEVETVRRGLAPAMEGARFKKVEVRRPDLRWTLPKDFAERLEGQNVEGLGRRAKYLLARSVIRRRAADASRHVRLVSRRPSSSRPGIYHHERSKSTAHDHVVFHMSNGESVTFNDPRRFGFMKLIVRARLDASRCSRRSGRSRWATRSMPRCWRKPAPARRPR